MVWETHVLPLCAWALLAEIPLFTDVRMDTRDGKYPCLPVCAIALVPVSLGVNVKITLCFSQCHTLTI